MRITSQDRPARRLAVSPRGGAHVAFISDGSFPIFLFSYWGRNSEDGRMPLHDLVRRQTREPARFAGLHDRGLLAPGMKADINVIEFAMTGTTRRPDAVAISAAVVSGYAAVVSRYLDVRALSAMSAPASASTRAMPLPMPRPAPDEDNFSGDVEFGWHHDVSPISWRRLFAVDGRLVDRSFASGSNPVSAHHPR